VPPAGVTFVTKSNQNPWGGATIRPLSPIKLPMDLFWGSVLPPNPPLCLAL